MQKPSPASRRPRKRLRALTPRSRVVLPPKLSPMLARPSTPKPLHDITEGEKRITGGERIKGGPTATAQSILAQERNETSSAVSSEQPSSGTLDSNTISKITAAEKDITGSETPVWDGPTARAQKHANEPINHDTLHDITEGEKKITGKQRPVASGPTATAQSELTNSRS
ncbi:hypothetical protein Z517_04537 [Fonsecaea pedrosoi CBS 271.37]|uniref:Unplaced genomic scaffold supercont1.3, whole genome shotgun sequence n=1 Tax=Fonsecaea pedrosoi CBS 271.37 TaxID=1442368 RepID=A0A0D2F4H1_9EURO|nr:uncharacterized protein Z517_04537 [Fonsecaea pedrosoi CBS 271.37]KIW81512.1 hypothetical protein Z517_04537 [Fonsecaea pedrosoi CBS 271.37]